MNCILIALFIILTIYFFSRTIQTCRVLNEEESIQKLESKSIHRPCLLTTDCVDTAVSYLKLLKDKVSNYEKQVSRMKTQRKTGINKAGKKGIFRGSVQRIVRAGGGNVSSLACNGETGSVGAENMKTLVTKLLGCEDGIANTCNLASTPQEEVTKVECDDWVDVWSLIS